MKKNLYMGRIYNMEMRLLIILLLVVLSAYSVSAVYVGLADGYVRDYDGSLVTGADVTAKVTSCSGGGCTSTSISETTGYYITANLNLPAQGSVQVTAIKGAGKGSVIVSANQYGIAHADVTLCYAPSSPTITPISNTHSTGVKFQWVSGSDPKGLSQYDQFQLDSGKVESLNSPITRQLAMGKHTWQVRTCNQLCCSSWVSNSFNVGNTAPSAPIPNWTSGQGIAILSWISGIDPDNDPIYDEFQLENKTTSPAFSPIMLASKIFIKWSVRTCDNLKACSNWVETYTVTCEEINVTCPTLEQLNETIKNCQKSAQDAAVEAAKAVSVVYCNGIKFSEESLNKVELKLGNSKTISIYGDNFSLLDIEYCPWCYDGKQDYDELGVDCGGSCPDCGAEVPLKAKGISFIVYILIAVLIILIIIYFLYRKYKKKETGKYK